MVRNAYVRGVPKSERKMWPFQNSSSKECSHKARFTNLFYLSQAVFTIIFFDSKIHTFSNLIVLLHVHY